MRKKRIQIKGWDLHFPLRNRWCSVPLCVEEPSFRGEIGNDRHSIRFCFRCFSNKDLVRFVEDKVLEMREKTLGDEILAIKRSFDL